MIFTPQRLTLKISEAQAEAQRYIRKHKVDRDWKFGDGPFKGCVVEIFKGKKKYATYRWVPYHARYETHLVMRGGRFRKQHKGEQMNKQRRTKIDEAMAKVADAKAIIEEVYEAEEEAYENLPESLQYSERGEQMQECVSALESAVSSFEELDDYLDEAKGE